MPRKRDFIKTNAEKSVQNVVYIFIFLELCEKRRGRQGNIILIFRKFINVIRKGYLRVVGAASDAFAAIDTALFHDCCLSFVDTDCLHGTPLDAIGASFTFLNIERH
jgi:hypothetical protein